MPDFHALAQWLRENAWFMQLSMGLITPIIAAVLTYLLTRPDAEPHQITPIVNEHVTVIAPLPGQSR